MDRCYLAPTVCAGAKKRLYLVWMNSLLLETLQDKDTNIRLNKKLNLIFFRFLHSFFGFSGFFKNLI